MERSLHPSEQVELNLTIAVPASPGHYNLELDLVWEGVVWFKDIANPTCMVDLEVR